MKYYSILQPNILVDFSQAVIEGQAPDGGLYFPEFIPRYNRDEMDRILTMDRSERCAKILWPYVEDTITRDQLFEICQKITSFNIPLALLNSNISILELFHGPTLAFKDIGARFLSETLAKITEKDLAHRTILVATSGDTGGAVAEAFSHQKNMCVVILYPKGGVSPTQEMQLTTNGEHVFAIEVDATFDQCQAMVKAFFQRPGAQHKYGLISANSINVARWIPQQIYYFDALAQWRESAPPIIAVPSGNFGNIAAGFLACASGLEVDTLIAACNANDTIPRFLNSQNWEPTPTISTLSNAMDISVPSNFIRVQQILKTQNSLTTRLAASSHSDQETADTIMKYYKEENYIMDPHTAVGIAALEPFLSDTRKGICLSTAHPVKFNKSVESIIEQPLHIPARIAELMQRKNIRKFEIEPQVDALSDFFNHHIN